MSLYSDLNEVLTPYANKIKGLVASDDQIKADLEDLEDRVEALEGGAGGGLTADIKSALLALFQHVAYADDDGQDYYDALYDALYPPADLVSISAVYTQSGAIYETNEIDDLKEDLVVTALMSDQTTRPVTDYTLSGTLTEGTSTITVTYGGKTATFTVTVTMPGYAPLSYIETTGAEYAESGIFESANPLSCETKIRRTSYSSTAPNAHILSSQNSYYSYQGTTNNVKNIKTKFNGGAASENAFTWELDTDYIIDTDVDNTSVKVNGTSIGTFAAGETYSASNQYIIAAYGGSPTQTKYRFIGRIYYITLYDSNGVVHDFRPATRLSDSITGFYDLVTDTFITSATSTQFTGA